MRPAFPRSTFDRERAKSFFFFRGAQCDANANATSALRMEEPRGSKIIGLGTS